MAKGKKTIIRNIKKINDDIIMVNDKEYVIIEDEEDIETAITMKISSHGNRILRFKDLNKKATIDVKRDIKIIKVTFTDKHRASRFKKSYNKSIITSNDKKEKIANASSHIKAKKIISEFTSKQSSTYDKQSKITTFYILETIQSVK
jgi:formylmethanofuran dehydrogenase subunit E